MKVLLIKPPWASLTTGTANVPVGLTYLAAAIEDIVEDVAVFNADYWEGRQAHEEYVFVENRTQSDASHRAFSLLRQVISSYQPDVVGVSLMTPEYNSAKNTVEIVKEICPTATIILGGIHVTLLPEETIRYFEVNYAIAGEGEKSFRRLIDSLKNNEDCVIPGVWHMKNGKVFRPASPVEPCLPHEIPLPALHRIINPDNQPIDYGMILTSRGCPAPCTFCATRKLWSGAVRVSSVSRIVTEVERLRNEFKVTNVRFVDDTFTSDRKNVFALCDELKKMDNIHWSADTQARFLDKDLLVAMKEAGCIQVNVGVETGSAKMYQKIRKGGSLEKTISVIQLANKQKLGVIAYFIIGFPGETEDDLNDTFELMKSLPACPIVSLATPYPGTQMHEQAREYVSDSILSNYSELYHHTSINLNMTVLSDDKWSSIKKRFHDEVKRLTLNYDMTSRHNVAKQISAPEVSVVIPCHNHGQYLSEAVESVFKQTYVSYEVIIVNDGSTDNTQEIAESLITSNPDKQILLINQENQGLAATRNNGIRKSKGKYILPLDADDMIHPEMLQKTVYLLETDNTIAIAYCDVIFFGVEGRKDNMAEYDFKKLLYCNLFSYCSLYRREAWEYVGGYNANMVWGYEDWDFWVACGENGFYGKRVPEYLFMYRAKEDSMLTKSLEKDKELRARIVLNHPGQYKKEEVGEARLIMDSVSSTDLSAIEKQLVSYYFYTDKKFNKNMKYVLLLGSFTGYQNFGDILQLKYAIDFHKKNTSLIPVVLCDIECIADEGYIDKLYGKLGVEYIIFYSITLYDTKKLAVSIINGPVNIKYFHTYGGGYLNEFWVDWYLSLAPSIIEFFGVGHYLLSGQQIDSNVTEKLKVLFDKYKPLLIGCRDEVSYESVKKIALGVAKYSFDDAFECISDIARHVKIIERQEQKQTILLHFNLLWCVHGKTTKEMVDVYRDMLEKIKKYFNDKEIEIILLIVFNDLRVPAVLDTPAVLQALEDNFDFANVRIVNLANIAFSYQPGTLDGYVFEIPDNSVMFTSSYHTAMLGLSLRMPVFLFSDNTYYEQKHKGLHLEGNDIGHFLNNLHKEEWKNTLNYSRDAREKWHSKLKEAYTKGPGPRLCKLKPYDEAERKGFIYKSEKHDIQAVLHNAHQDILTEKVKNRKLAIIVPYRDRKETLDKFIPHMRDFMQKHHPNLEYKIFVIEQEGKKLFNRGKLLNIGFDLAKVDYGYFCFHDLDLLPENDSCDYSYVEVPTQMAIYLSQWNYNTISPTDWNTLDAFGGGVALFNGEDFEQIGGYSNEFEGWGGEDNEIHDKIRKNNLTVGIRKGRYFCLPHEVIDLWGDEAETTRNKWNLMEKKSIMCRERRGLDCLKYSVSGRGPINDISEKVLVDVSSHLKITTSDFIEGPDLRRDDLGKAPLVSVIVPTCNRPEMLKEALMSILSQTYKNFEIIVVNDGGKDVKDVIDLLNKEGKIVYLQHKDEKGPSAARNTALKVSKGKYIAYLDDDDIYYANHLETLVGSLEKNDYKVAYTDAYQAFQTWINDKYITTVKEITYSFDFDRNKFLLANYIHIITIVHRKDLLDKVGVFDEDLETHEDWELCIRLSQHCDFHHIKSVTAEFRMREDKTNATTLKSASFLHTIKLIYERYSRLITDASTLEHQNRTVEYMAREVDIGLKEQSINHYECLHRYRFTKEFVKGKNVLNVSCDDGYGSFILSEVAESVTSINMDTKSIKYASSRYIKENLKFVKCHINDINIKEEKIFDVIVCFGTLERVEQHDKLMIEVKRLIKDDGIFIASIFNKGVCSDPPDYQTSRLNRLYLDEFKVLLKNNYKNTIIFGQKVFPSSNIFSLSGIGGPIREFAIERGDKEFFVVPSEKKEALYFITVSSDSSISNDVMCNSHLVDVSETIFKQNVTHISSLKSEIREKGLHVRVLDRTIKDMDTHTKNLESAIKEKDAYTKGTITHIGNLEVAIRDKDTYIESIIKEGTARVNNLEAAVRDSEAALNQVYNSNGGKALLLYYKVRNRLIPPNSKRSFLAKFVFNSVLNPRGIFRNISTYIFKIKEENNTSKDLTKKKINVHEKPAKCQSVNSRLNDFNINYYSTIKNPLVTVIVPNYDHAEYLEERLNSIYNQTYDNFEVLLLDDFSKDNSREILKKYKDKFADKTRLLFNSENSGSVFSQWGKGISEAKGGLIWIAESDDYCSDNFLEETIPYFNSESVLLSYCNTIFVDRKGDKQIWSLEEFLTDVPGFSWKSPFVASAHQLLAHAWSIKNILPNASSAIFRKPVNMKLLKSKIWKEMKCCGDWLFYVHLVRGGVVAYTTKATSYYRIHGKNASVATHSKDVYYKEHEIVAKHIHRLYDILEASLIKQEAFLINQWKINRSDYSEKKFKNCYNIESIKRYSQKRLPNLLMSTYSFAAGGGETFPIQLANIFKEYGYSVTFLSCEKDEREIGVRDMLRKDIPVIDNFLNLNYIVQYMNIELIHSHHACVDDLIINLLDKKLSARHIISLHGMYEMLDESRQKEVLKNTINNVGRIVYAADKNIQPFKKYNLYTDNQFVKIGNALTEYTIRPANLNELGIDHNSFTLCLVSRAMPEKGWKEAVEIIKLSRKMSGADVHLLMIGEGSEYDLLKDKSPEYIHFLGFKSNIRDYYAVSDFGFLPTRFEGESFPLTIIDCLLAGKPVIATDVGEISKMLSCNGKTAGSVFSLNNGSIPVEEVSEIITNYIRNKSLYLSQLKNVAEVANKFCPERLRASYHSVYMELFNES